MAALNWMMKPAITGMAVLAMALPASAGSFNFAFSFGKSPQRAAVVVGSLARAVRAPARVWVPPVYSTVMERVWVPTVTTAYRDVPVVDCFGNVVSYRREPYTVNGGYWHEEPRQVLVREGYWAVERPAPVAVVHVAGGHGERPRVKR